MKIKIEFDTDNASFEDNFDNQVANILSQAMSKIEKQLSRPECSCTHPEAEDRLFDFNGNTVGKVSVED